jgi:hypothetical protein
MEIVHRHKHAGRPRSWSEQLLISIALEWHSRHGRLPRASDWSTAKAARAGAAALQRLHDPPTGAARWPPASTVNNRFGSWDAFREACDADVAPQEVWTRVQQMCDGSLRIGVLGDTRVVKRAYALWRAAREPSDDDELWFLVWTLLDSPRLLVRRTRADIYAALHRPGIQAALVAGELEITFAAKLSVAEGEPQPASAAVGR